MFLRCCGILNYGIFKELTPSAELREKGFQALVRFMRLMKGKQNPKRNPIAKIFTFNSRNGNPVRIRMKYKFITIFQFPGRNADRSFSSVNHKQTKIVIGFYLIWENVRNRK